MQPADQIALVHRSAQIDHRLPDSVSGTGDVLLEPVGLDQLLRRRAGRPDLLNLTLQQAVMAEHIEHTFESVPHAFAAGCFAAAELAADGNFAFRLRFVGEQPRGHRAGINKNEGRVEQSRRSRGLRLLRLVGDRVKRRADGKRPLLAARMDVNHHAS